MARMRITADIDPDLRRRVRIAAVESDQTLSEWIEGALRDKLRDNTEGEINGAGRRYTAPGMSLPPPGVKPRGSKYPPGLRDEGDTVANAVIKNRDGMYLPPAGAKPKGSKNPPRLKDGSKISDAVIEDRR